jgi:hypothetical protein
VAGVGRWVFNVNVSTSVNPTAINQPPQRSLPPIIMAGEAVLKHSGAAPSLYKGDFHCHPK